MQMVDPQYVGYKEEQNTGERIFLVSSCYHIFQILYCILIFCDNLGTTFTLMLLFLCVCVCLCYCLMKVCSTSVIHMTVITFSSEGDPRQSLDVLRFTEL